jgi:hypothetical protein
MTQHTVYSEFSNLVGNIEVLLNSYLNKMESELEDTEVNEIKTFLTNLESSSHPRFQLSSKIYKTPLSEVTSNKPSSFNCCG